MDTDFKRLLLAVLLCMLIVNVWLIYRGRQQKPPAPADTPQTTTPAPIAPGDPGKTTPAIAQAPPDGAQPPAGAWRIRPVEPAASPLVVGALEPDKSTFKAQITYDPLTAALAQVRLSEYKLNVIDDHTGYPLLLSAVDNQNRPRQSLMVTDLTLSGQSRPYDLSQACWRAGPLTTDPCTGARRVSFTASLVDDNDRPVLEVVKTFSYAPDDYCLDFSLRLENKSTQPLAVDALEVIGPAGLRREAPRSDRRNAVALYLDREQEPQIERELLTKIVSKPLKGAFEKPADASLTWLALSNKFFTAVLEPQRDPNPNVRNRDPLVRGEVYAEAVTTTPTGESTLKPESSLSVSTTLHWDKPLQANAAYTQHFQVYLGPIDKEVFDARYAGRGFENLIYRPACSMCSFNWLTYLIFRLMKGIFTIVHNYGVAIIVLVLLVRFILHPISKRSTMNMMKMQKLQPKMEEIRTKYAGNKEEIQRRTMEVYKDQGMAGNMLLGCLPMFLQLPIWIALFTAVDANIALRHQGLLPASWHWLNDLTAPDRLIPFTWFGVTDPVQIPLIGGIDAFNLLPILLCIAMFLQTKFSPQSRVTSAANPQAAQQQKIMMYMIPGMMLIFFYSAPSGLNLYIMASTFGGLIEQHFTRKHIKQEQEKADAGTVEATTKLSSRIGPKKRKPKPPVRFFK